MKKRQTSPQSLSAERTVHQRLLDVLQQVDRPGTFVSHGSLDPVLPGLEIAGIGTIGFPLALQQAELIRNLCDQAPYGRGEQTLVDTSVRRVWQMMPDKFRLKNRQWQQFLQGIVRTVEEELGLEGKQLEPQLYNLLLYEAGCFFLPHRDGEKVEGMVATLVVILPSDFTGGELVVRHDGNECRVDFGADEDCGYKTHFTAFFADCEHEVLPLREGFRLCLVYNLVLKNIKGSLTAPRNTECIDAVALLLQDWCDNRGETDSDKLIVKLDHRYTQNGLAWDSLKGIDGAKAQILRRAADKAGCVAHIAELTYWEQGLGEEYGGSWNRRWHSEMETADSARYNMQEIYETSLTARLWVIEGEQRIPFGELSVDEDEIVSRSGLTDINPVEEFEGYMGNYGDTLERWYRHAAIVLWPKECHFDVLCQLGTSAAIVELSSMVQDFKVAHPDQRSDLKAKCVQLAQQIIDQWSCSRLDWQPPVMSPGDSDFDDVEDDDEDYDDSDDSAEEDEDDLDSDEKNNDAPADDSGQLDANRHTVSSFLSCLEFIGDIALTQEFLRVVVPKDNSIQLTAPFLHYCRNQGLAHFSEGFKQLFRNTAPDTLDRNVRLFVLLCSEEFQLKKEFSTLRAEVVQELVAALKSIDKQKDDWQSSKINRLKILNDMIPVLVTTEELEGLASLVSYTLAAPQRYAPRLLASLQCQLKDWLIQHSRVPCAISNWLDASVSFLQMETALEPQKPNDFKRTANIACRCNDCRELIDFLKSPTQSVYRFKVRKERRAHLHRIIDSKGCDVNHVTERKGSPQTLICTKNTNSYQRSLKQYLEDRENLAVIQSLREQLLQLWASHR